MRKYRVVHWHSGLLALGSLGLRFLHKVGNTQKYRKGVHECRKLKTILIDLLYHVHISQSIRQLNQNHNFWLVWHMFCNLWAAPSICESVSVDNNNIEHKTENYDKLRGWALIIMATQSLSLLYTPGYITLLQQASDLRFFLQLLTKSMHDKGGLLFAHHTLQLVSIFLYLGLNVMFRLITSPSL